RKPSNYYVSTRSLSPKGTGGPVRSHFTRIISWPCRRGDNKGMGHARILLAAVLLLGGCGHAAQQTAVKPTATVDPELLRLRVQLVQARAERDAALARLHALERRKPAVVRVVVRQPATGVPRS